MALNLNIREIARIAGEKVSKRRGSVLKKNGVGDLRGCA